VCHHLKAKLQGDACQAAAVHKPVQVVILHAVDSDGSYAGSDVQQQLWSCPVTHNSVEQSAAAPLLQELKPIVWASQYDKFVAEQKAAKAAAASEAKKNKK